MASWLTGIQALACPTCDSVTAEQVRQGIMNQDFWLNMGAILLPFLIFTVIAIWIYIGDQHGNPHDSI